MGLGDKAAAFKLVERTRPRSRLRKTHWMVPLPVEILARVAAQMRETEPRHGRLSETALDGVLHWCADWRRAAHSSLLRLDSMFDPIGICALSKLAGGNNSAK